MNPKPKIFAFRDSPVGSPYRVIYSPFRPVYEKGRYIELYSYASMTFLPMFWESAYNIEVGCGECKVLDEFYDFPNSSFLTDILGFKND